MFMVGDLVGTDGNKECSYRIVWMDKERQTAGIQAFTMLGLPATSTYTWTMKLSELHQVKLEMVQLVGVRTTNTKEKLCCI